MAEHSLVEALLYFFILAFESLAEEKQGDNR